MLSLVLSLELSLEPSLEVPLLRTLNLAARTHYLRKVTHGRKDNIASSRAPVGAKKSSKSLKFSSSSHFILVDFKHADDKCQNLNKGQKGPSKE